MREYKGAIEREIIRDSIIYIEIDYFESVDDMQSFSMGGGMVVGRSDCRLYMS